jgi:hypothetical protein
MSHSRLRRSISCIAAGLLIVGPVAVFCIAALVLLLNTGRAKAQKSVEMPAAFHGEWCRDGGTCPDGFMTVMRNGFESNAIRCELRKARFRPSEDTNYRASSAGVWRLTFKCTDSDKLVEEQWFFLAHKDTVLVVIFDLPNGGIRLVQYLPRTKKDRG